MPSLKRRTRDVSRAMTPVGQDNKLSARNYRYLGRRPRLQGLPVRRPPFIAVAVTAAVFIFLAYLVLGGA